MPTFAASFEAAERAGDLRPDAGAAANALLVRPPRGGDDRLRPAAAGRSAVPLPGALDEVIADAARFILRGIGLTRRGDRGHFDPAALPAPAAARAAA